MLKHKYSEEVGQETVYIICTYNGDRFQRTIYGSYDTLERAQKAVDQIKANGIQREISIYNAELITVWHKE